MKFTVEVEDFYIEEGDIASELKHQIKNAVVGQIRENVKQQVDAFMDGHVKAEINAELKTRVQLLMDDFLASGKVKDGYNSKEEITIKEWTAKYFQGKQPEIIKFIEAQAKKHTLELQQRYDMLFATQLITKIKEQGFLKEEAAKMLLTTEGGN